tara:strand:- start:3778 stop:4581 length:804 start_codon:yes stop_codon:yes gene_type:complete
MLELTNLMDKRKSAKSKFPNSIKGAGFMEIPLWKRTFDIIGSSLLILLLSPLFLLIYMIVKLESTGPAIYTSKRVGQGFKVFPFYKFRSMYFNADQRVKDMQNQNQYSTGNSEIQVNIEVYNQELLDDSGIVEESEFQKRKIKTKKHTFFKVAEDVRITGFGRIIRNTSLDELPQLFNVLKGHMSIVGNRPLPVYEAEKLTSDEWIERFASPSGITGLWQVEGRGGGDVSSEERKKLDITYAKNYGPWLDLKILLKTIPAVIQKANV